MSEASLGYEVKFCSPNMVVQKYSFMTSWLNSIKRILVPTPHITPLIKGGRDETFYTYMWGYTPFGTTNKTSLSTLVFSLKICC
jgi:hypothetical protein